MGKDDRKCVSDKTNVSGTGRNGVNENFTHMGYNFKIVFFFKENVNQQFQLLFNIYDTEELSEEVMVLQLFEKKSSNYFYYSESVQTASKDHICIFPSYFVLSTSSAPPSFSQKKTSEAARSQGCACVFPFPNRLHLLVFICF